MVAGKLFVGDMDIVGGRSAQSEPAFLYLETARGIVAVEND
jgi:hypothetical protein